jgi:peptide chain release factor subunit 1
MDSREARLYLIRSNVLENRGSASIDLMNKHKKGGWSQMRFNRLRRGAIRAFQRDVVNDLRELPDLAEIRGIVVAGPGEAKDQLVQMLPPSLKDKLLGSIDVSMNTSPSELMSLGGDRVVRSDANEAAIMLKAAILKGMPAAYGYEEVREALLQARVKTLILGELNIPGMICKSCRITPAISLSSCPSCGGHLSHENMAEELYELAQRTDADVALAKDDGFLDSIGGIGALLRY